MRHVPMKRTQTTHPEGQADPRQGMFDASGERAVLSAADAARAATEMMKSREMADAYMNQVGTQKKFRV